MRVLMVSKALVVESYRSKLTELTNLGVDITSVVPESWVEEGHEIRFEEESGGGNVIRTKLAWNGHFHLHYYPALGHILDTVRPDVLHMDEEPYNLATYLAVRRAAKLQIASVFFTWQNIHRIYPPPFRQFERYAYQKSAYRWRAVRKLCKF